MFKSTLMYPEREPVRICGTCFQLARYISRQSTVQNWRQSTDPNHENKQSNTSL